MRHAQYCKLGFSAVEMSKFPFFKRLVSVDISNNQIITLMIPLKSGVL